ncbi:UreD urease accessory protein-domain-containing protein [Sphaerosporella brunnea]|uniref:UreD urease accessory protein-domain-containing protein n=1 Tax=Sphaerosporella brunnea TaxID=1250544 RepID=A0A5J5F7S3_9PEZI|nr:UreD urease accessory protein-domain-containing protein [Sphaerosporella brunnea]
MTAGQGHIRARLLPPARLSLPQLTFQYPLKLISSSVPSSKCLTVFILSYGGGLVSNDQVDLKVVVEDAAKLCLLTQGSTKIFKRKAFEHLTTQSMAVHLQSNAVLALLPDPIQPFKDSVYKQHQVFHLPADDTASLVVLDWVSEGRSARGEHWDLTSFVSRNEFFIPKGEGESERLMLRDSMILTQDAEGLRSRMDGFTVFATLMIHGPRFAGLSEALLQKFKDEPRIGGRNFDNRRDFKNDTTKKGGVIWTATSMRGFVLVKLSGKELEEVKIFLRELLKSGEDEGDVVREFGEGALLCLQ